MWLKATAAIVILLVLGSGVALLWGARRWRDESALVVARIESMGAVTSPGSMSAPTHYSVRELEGLPAPVQRYFEHVLRDSQPLVRLVRLTQTGEMRMGETEDSWRPFTASEILAARPAALLWDARIRQAPGLTVFVRDSYVGGAGGMRADILGLKTVMNAASDHRLAEGALYRLLAEAVWAPTALLPNAGVTWTALDDSSAVATLRDGATSASVTFHMNEIGEIVSMRVAGRARSVGAGYVMTPWEGRFWQYETREGMRIPLQGEVSWRIDGVSRPYWRGKVTSAAFDFGQR